MFASYENHTLRSSLSDWRSAFVLGTVPPRLGVPFETWASGSLRKILSIHTACYGQDRRHFAPLVHGGSL